MEIVPVLMCFVSDGPVILHPARAGDTAPPPAASNSPINFDDICSRDVINRIQ